MLWDYLKAIVFGIVEGITEWLPVSSTGHLILLESIISLECVKALGEEYRNMFDVVIQLAAVMAVAAVYRGELFPHKENKKQVLSLWGKLILATLPAALIGLGGDMLCESFLGVSLDSLLFTPATVATALIIYGILFILVERFTRNSIPTKSITCPTALAIGFFQALAIIPGTSRSGATILGARILGLERRTAAEFSFFAAIPVIFSASLLKIVDFGEYVMTGGVSLPLSAILLLILAGTVAFLVSMSVIRFLTDFLKRHTFIPFGVYRILLGIAVLIFMNS
jgi:undecaprenyl-diphosphatase